MQIFLDIIIIILGAFLILFALYLFLVAPRFNRRKKCKELLVSYAHRGLYDTTMGIPENSISAFKRAVESGFGIELDVQLSADNVIMVFHDATLLRMCGLDKKLSDLTAAELCEISLQETNCKIPTFDEVLEAVAGKIPLLIELKGADSNTKLCDYVCKRLDSYKGAFCIESFNPLFIRKIKKLRPDFIRGQLVTNLVREGWDGKKYLAFAMSNLLLNVLSRPDFIAFNRKYKRDFSVLVLTVLLRTPSFVWTIKKIDEHSYFGSKKISTIFEGFVPDELSNKD